ncbi:winged helix-turn-helix domain-containing protein [Methanolobus mangrovi]|uniref:Winged helix-turn-helix domain-containing protein n=1 Tax=Methanolobus mangrovi TaxID=3072977 RepID=A0AA51YHA7_9EURY|nr:winged helix-turn-helix domain-containing protein [Methanolobus mangrovi]WMW22966.1 winged helix-turn-helix domain-containing protein [Methanolobus mangrovi]
MKKSLLDVLFKSQKRKNMLIMLQEEPKKMETLLKTLKTTRQALLPQTKILQDNYLVTHYNDTYELTTIGELIVDKMTPLLDTIDFLDIDIDYWGTHNLDFIPPYLLKRLNENKNAEIISPSLVSMYEINKDFIEQAHSSGSLYFIFTFMHPSFPPTVYKFIDNNIDVSIIITKELLRKIKTEYYDDLKNHLMHENIKFYLYEQDIKIGSFALSDYHLILRLLSKDNEYDNKQLFFSDPKALQWGKDLFDYYLKDATLIAEP